MTDKVLDKILEILKKNYGSSSSEPQEPKKKKQKKETKGLSAEVFRIMQEKHSLGHEWMTSYYIIGYHDWKEWEKFSKSINFDICVHSIRGILGQSKHIARSSISKVMHYKYID
jgi:hypothetical protein